MAASNPKVNGKVVDCLYPIDADFASKQKTLEIMKVMKGALSVAKSRTGEVIYRHNKLEDESLKRQLKRFDKAQKQTAVALDSRKRTVMRHWGLVFDKQKSMNESIRHFDSVLTEYFRHFDESRRASRDQGEVTQEEDDEENKGDGEKDGDDDKKEEDEDIMTRRGIQRIRLQPIGVGKNSQIKVRTPTPEPELEEVESWPLERHEWISDYIDTQRSKHRKLVTKNILRRLQKGLTKGESLYRFKLRATLADDPLESINAIVTSRSARTRASPLRMVKTAPEFPTHTPKSRVHIDHHGEPITSKTPKFLTSDKDTYKDFLSPPRTKFPPIEGITRSKTMHL